MPTFPAECKPPVTNARCFRSWNTLQSYWRAEVQLSSVFQQAHTCYHGSDTQLSERRYLKSARVCKAVSCLLQHCLSTVRSRRRSCAGKTTTAVILPDAQALKLQYKLTRPATASSSLENCLSEADVVQQVVQQMVADAIDQIGTLSNSDEPECCGETLQPVNYFPQTQTAEQPAKQEVERAANMDSLCTRGIAGADLPCPPAKPPLQRLWWQLESLSCTGLLPEHCSMYVRTRTDCCACTSLKLCSYPCH